MILRKFCISGNTFGTVLACAALTETGGGGSTNSTEATYAVCEVENILMLQ